MQGQALPRYRLQEYDWLLILDTSPCSPERAGNKDKGTNSVCCHERGVSICKYGPVRSEYLKISGETGFFSNVGFCQEVMV